MIGVIIPVICLIIGLGLLIGSRRIKPFQEYTDALGAVQRKENGELKQIKKLLIGGGFAVLIFGIIVLLIFSIIIIPAGHTGVRFNPLAGGVQPDELNEGIHLIWPYVSVTPYSIRTIEVKEKAGVPTTEGLIATLDVSIWYKLMPDRVDEVHKTIGEDYSGIIIAPQIRSVLRGVTASYEAKALYTADRIIIADQIIGELEPILEERGIVLESVLLREVKLPEKVTKAIEMKLEAEQEAEKMVWLVEKEKLEKERRIIEAEGISKANEIIAGSLTNSYLTWYWIDNLDSHDSVLYVPVGQGGLPIFKEVEIPRGE